MRYIDWNIKCYCQIDKIVSFLKQQILNSNCIVALQEVMPEKAEVIKKNLEPDYHIIYSLDYYPSNDEFDTDNRRLGVMFAISKDIEIAESGVFERCIFPERTLYTTISVDGIERKIVNFHSLTGVSFKMGKAVQYRRFAESVDLFKPDILSMDANEPKIDHYDIEQMEFFDQGDSGKGARIFFDELRKCGLVDAYANQYDIEKYKRGEPLVISHIINQVIPRRYDFVFVKENLHIKKIDYYYQEACDASSDHAMIVVEI